jgi:hypothetical protein
MRELDRLVAMKYPASHPMSNLVFLWAFVVHCGLRQKRLSSVPMQPKQIFELVFFTNTR